ncbi:ATP-binding protein [Flavobacterium johnsoniae]|uniref:histidine kinase n=1 Tax=Flavobacterium johnsoniae (strain ATCC 17061 / DSM 2064 / JCM 8514 / BCRC 14874 / CCUG 350202 / NBRC 14942 / NCIMB 11054 / UW101) TaxID=376686 RepID=A5FCX0_FLAJ1|nr:ATP-binding protein [Flavobacterium johnsoniae]ABQ06946.1 multi-sensor signal transduction histidine kinase [Flavobacterium johnsoniae UW101]OXE97198.1 histidine kinase [Flavobacterium johnsoniae UW101]WQG81220.1 ATP-binding protein [Flavobacterium johnsoniae UW101]SHL35602.1 Bacteriophytochrome (light-regulated signal transduction histidine kinase) [Flavobacterium johnsoniae]
MNIKDIVNRDLVTLTNCEHEPIHIPGSIQPHGFLIGLDSDLKIDFCTANISLFVDLQHTDILGKNFTAIFGSKQQKQILDYINEDKIQNVFPLEINLLGKSFQVSIHKSYDIYVLEAELKFADREKLADVYTQTIQFVTQMNNTTSLKDLCALVAEGTREITGYDRVMIYKFDELYNGEVFAESCREDLEPFLGLHYPHTDIPVQARELYIKNQLRLIVDINYKPVPIFTIDDNKENKNLDLSLSILRSTSPIHVEYLKNMGVGATLTISLIHHDRLWGLIACHHYSKKNISPEIRLAAKLQGQFITSQIDIRQSNDENVSAQRASLALEELTSLELPLSDDSLETIVNTQEILNLCNASGVSVSTKDKIYKSTLAPSDDYIRTLTEQITKQIQDKTFVTNKLSDYFSEIERCPDFAGILYHSLDSHSHIIWYRPETISEINWGGDPEKAIVKDNNGLHPRNSFNIWKQIIKNQSNTWKQYEINTAIRYSHTLHNHLMLIMLSKEEEKYRTQSEVLKETNSELENINWISTHDLQEPLRKIQMITSKMLTELDVIPLESIHSSLVRVSKSAGRMRILLEDILKFTRIKNTRDVLQKVDLNQILKTTTAEMKENIKESKAVIQSENLPEVYAVSFLMRQLFSNLIQNSLKYASPDRSPVIKITASQEPELFGHLNKIYCHWVNFSDNGIGFEQQYAETIFKVFSRLHNQDEYTGSGVGLALCKKIMQTVGGNIEAVGKVGEGTEIKIYFPCDPEETLL